jgi:hypothetical protein
MDMGSDGPPLDDEVYEVLRIPDKGASLLTCEEVAEMLRVPEATLVRWASHGLGPPFYGWAKTPFYRRTEVLSWLRTEPMPLNR